MTFWLVIIGSYCDYTANSQHHKLTQATTTNRPHVTDVVPTSKTQHVPFKNQFISIECWHNLNRCISCNTLHGFCACQCVCVCVSAFVWTTHELVDPQFEFPVPNNRHTHLLARPIDTHIDKLIMFYWMIHAIESFRVKRAPHWFERNS